MSEPQKKKVEKRCTKDSPCDPAKVNLDEEQWTHEDVEDLFPDFEKTVYRCLNCGTQIEMDFS